MKRPRNNDRRVRVHGPDEDFQPDEDQLLIVLIAGLAALAITMNLVAGLLRQFKYQVVVLEGPGYGRDWPMRVKKSAKRIIASGKLGAGKKLYIGFSAGASLATALAVLDPDNTAGLISVASLLDCLTGFFNCLLKPWLLPAYLMKLKKAGYKILTWFGGFLLFVAIPYPERVRVWMVQREHTVRLFGRVLFRFSLQKYLKPYMFDPKSIDSEALELHIVGTHVQRGLLALAANLGLKPAKWAARVTVPTWLIVGQQDPFCGHPDCSAIRRAHESAAVKANVGFQIHVIEDCGHCIHIERPRDVVRLIIRFIEIHLPAAAV